MRPSSHYYVISLGQPTALFEAFRDVLIDIRHEGFPLNPSMAADEFSGSTDRDDRLRQFLRVVDERFEGHYRLEPMMVVVAGEEDLQSVFTSVSAHRTAIVGRVEGDFTATSLRDLGKIVWPVVKEAMSGLRERALRDLELTADARKTWGLEAVIRHVNDHAGGTLMVEDDFHLRGSISEADGPAIILPNVDVRDEIDDVVDMIMEKVLGTGGNVIFMPHGSLSKLGRIVLLSPEDPGPR